MRHGISQCAARDMPDESRWANSEHVFSRPETIDIVRDRWHYSDDFGGFRAASKGWIFQVLAFGVWKIAMESSSRVAQSHWVVWNLSYIKFNDPGTSLGPDMQKEEKSDNL